MAPRKAAAAPKKASRAKPAAAAAGNVVAAGDSMSVALDAGFTHRVVFARNAFGNGGGPLADILREGCRENPRVLAVVDYNVARQTQGLPGGIAAAMEAAGATPAGKPVLAAGGEQAKNDGGRTAWALANTMLSAGLSRGDCVLAIGGGAVLDAACFAAAAVRGGIATVRMPTTLLAQCASGCSVSCGVDTPARKNAFSARTSAIATVCDFSFLSSLTPENFRNGIPEAVRTAALHDREFLEWIGENAGKLAVCDAAAAEETVRRSVAAGMRGLAERGAAGSFCRFGGWAADRLQETSRWRLWHGYALAMGVCIDTAYAVQKRWLPEEDGDLIGTILHKTGGLYGLERFPQLLDNAASLTEGLAEWGENLRGPLAVSYPGPLGEERVETDVDAALYAGIVKELRETSAELARRRREAAKAPAPGPAPEAAPEEPPREEPAPQDAAGGEAPGAEAASEDAPEA